MRERAVFLDRDGTIARDVHYCRRVEDCELLPNVPKAIRLLNVNGFKVVVITNQSGIARGYFTEETLAQIHNKMKDELAEQGAHVDAIYYCPHHPDEDCDCRKPKTALFLQAVKELNIDLSRSFVVGDMRMDIDAGKALGCKAALVTTGPQVGNGIIDPPDYTADSLLDAARWIVSNTELTPQPITTTILVPAYNEEKGLPVVLSKISNLIDETYEIIVVDDGSDDGTSEAALRFPVRLIRHKVNKGKGEAVKTGIKNARGENIILIDADDTYPVETIPQMAQALKTYDMVYGSRVTGRENIPHFNRLGNFIFQTMISRIYGFKLRDYCTGLYAIRKSYLEAMNLSSHRFAIEPEISIKGSRMNLKMLDIPIEYRDRVGSAKLNGVKAGFEHLWTILRLVFWRKSRGND